jgi:plasmid stabilization system protein ParE
LRRLTSGSHVIFYLVTDFGVEVVRVLHSSMDMYARLADDL